MRLDYKILWIENEEDFVDSFLPRVATFLSEKGFDPTIIKVLDEAQVDNYLNIDYDLIISDFNLNETNGDVVIYELRNNKKLDTEILFYSSKTNFLKDSDIKDKLAFMERINIQYGRDSLLKKIETVIELTLKKLLEINATRGLITAATSDLDVEIEEIYYLLVDKKFDEESSLKIEKYFKKDYNEIRKNLLKTCRAKRDSHTGNYKVYFSQSDSFRKWKLLKEFVSLNIPDGFDMHLFKLYYDEVIDIRNKFAHAKAVEIEGKLVLKGHIGGEDFVFNEESCIKIRQNILNHKRNIQTLKAIINK